jgi:lysophospholipase L1-like esterase
LNAGIGGDKTNEILWRINDGLLNGLSPKLVVLAIGVNNIWRNDFGNARVAEGIEKCVSAIRAKTPKTKVLVVGIFPTQESAMNELRTRVKEVNAETKKRVGGMKDVRFADIGDRFLSPDGSLSKEIMPDFVHASEEGYAIYGANLEAIVKEMLR